VKGRRKGYSMADAIRYHISRKDPIEMEIGWVGPSTSMRWRALAKMHQEGFERPVTDRQRRYFARRGHEIKRARYRRVFFLRKLTRTFRTPARPILEPFWRAHRNEAARNIAKNFRRKMRGEYIK